MFSAADECSEENDCDDVAECEDTTYGYTCKCDHKGFEDLSTGGKACIGQNKTVKIEVSIANHQSTSRPRCSLNLVTE